MLGSIPTSRPIFICPTDTEREIHFLICQELIKRTFQQTLPVEPIVIKTKSIQAIFFSKFHLTCLNLRNSQIVKTEFARQARLVVPDEIGCRFGDIGPF